MIRATKESIPGRGRSIYLLYSDHSACEASHIFIEWLLHWGKNGGSVTVAIKL